MQGDSASPWSWRAGLAAGALGTRTFATTVSILFALPVWDEASGGFPWLNFLGSFLIKDVALLGISVANPGPQSLERRGLVAFRALGVCTLNT